MGSLGLSLVVTLLFSVTAYVVGKIFIRFGISINFKNFLKIISALLIYGILSYIISFIIFWFFGFVFPILGYVAWLLSVNLSYATIISYLVVLFISCFIVFSCSSFVVYKVRILKLTRKEINYIIIVGTTFLALLSLIGYTQHYVYKEGIFLARWGFSYSFGVLPFSYLLATLLFLRPKKVDREV